MRSHPECDFPYRKEIRYLDPLYYHPFEKIQQKRFQEFSRKFRNLTDDGTKPLNTARARELRWWSRYAFVTKEECTDAWYWSLFEHCDSEKLTGGFSPDYSLLPPEGVDHLYRLVPHAKLVFMLRHPIDRLWSGVAYAVRARDDFSLEKKSEKAHNHLNRPMQVAFSDYPGIIRNFERRFPRENILYLFNDDVADDSAGLLKRTCAHLGITCDATLFPKVEKSINRSPQITLDPQKRIELTRKYLPDLHWLAERFGGRAEAWLADAERLLNEAG